MLEESLNYEDRILALQAVVNFYLHKALQQAAHRFPNLIQSFHKSKIEAERPAGVTVLVGRVSLLRRWLVAFTCLPP
jgi:hypothetical protein